MLRQCILTIDVLFYIPPPEEALGIYIGNPLITWHTIPTARRFLALTETGRLCRWRELLCLWLWLFRVYIAA